MDDSVHFGTLINEADAGLVRTVDQIIGFRTGGRFGLGSNLSVLPEE